ncbi:MAG: hypothetical protein ABI462_07755 [Ignavibacteria bacterium]
MLKGKAIDTIKTFSKEEYKRFEDFIASPYFNKSKRFVSLTAILKKFHPDLDSKTLTEEYVYGKIYGKNKFSYSLMKNLMAEYFKLCETFLIHDRVNRTLFTSTDNIIGLLEEYQMRDLDKAFNVRLKLAEDQLEESKFDSYYFDKKLAIVNFTLDNEFNKSSFKTPMVNAFIEKAFLELCRITNALYRNSNSIYYSSKEFNMSHENNIFFTFIKNIDINTILKQINFSNTENNFIIKIYLELIQLIRDQKNEKNYFSVKKLIFEKINYFSNLEKFSLLNILRNYCIDKIHDRNVKFKNEGNEINLKLLETVDFKKDKLDSLFGLIYLGTFLYAVGVKDFEFAEKFIEKNAPLLRNENRKDIYGYVRSYLEFEKGNFETALVLLSDIDAFNMVYYTKIKNLYLKIYYEMGYYEEAFSMLDTYKHFLDNKKILKESIKENLRDSIELFYKLFKIRSQPDKYSAYDVKEMEEDALSKSIETENLWILKKIKQLYKIVDS